MASTQVETVPRTTSNEEQLDDQKGHTGFLQKIKDKLHIGHKSVDKEEAHQEAQPEAMAATPPATSDKKSPVNVIKEKLHIGKKSDDSATTLESETATPPTSVDTTSPEKQEISREGAATSVVPPTSAGAQEGEHHGGVPTFLTKIDDSDMPEEVTKGPISTAPSDTPHEVAPTKFDGLVGHESEHHGGVPTFIAALPDQDIPDEVTKEVSTDVSAGHHAHEEGFNSAEVFSEAQQGEHHHGVPTFLVALPDQDIPEEVTKETSEAGKDHHGGVPTFLTQLDDQVPAEVNQGVSTGTSYDESKPAERGSEY